MVNTDVVYTGEDCHNWFYDRYYYGGGNSRYYTFQLALNLLQQRHPDPVIIETGCQRQEEDVGAGMSTSIFAEYIERYGGSLIAVDIEVVHLQRAQQYVKKWPGAPVTFVASDSVKYLSQYEGKVDLLYLDSLDYPIAENLGNMQMQLEAQNHCLKELLVIEDQLDDKSIVLIDDNQLGGGGKPLLAKQHLVEQGWTCLLDLQSTLWVKEI